MVFHFVFGDIGQWVEAATLLVAEGQELVITYRPATILVQIIEEHFDIFVGEAEVHLIARYPEFPEANVIPIVFVEESEHVSKLRKLLLQLVPKLVHQFKLLLLLL